MNQYTNRKKLSEREKTKNQPEGKPWVFPLLCKLILVPAALFAAFTLRVSYADKAEKLETQAVQIREQLRFIDKEIQNLKGRREEMYSLKHIDSKIREFNLGLRQTTNNQLRYLKSYDMVNGGLSTGYSIAGTRQHDDARRFASVETHSAEIR